jgi:hypothetical protein
MLMEDRAHKFNPVKIVCNMIIFCNIPNLSNFIFHSTHVNYIYWLSFVINDYYLINCKANLFLLLDFMEEPIKKKFYSVDKFLD